MKWSQSAVSGGGRAQWLRGVVVHKLPTHAASSSLPEKTLMLPLADGSLRLRTDDEDSSVSEDSFFSAAEVT